MTSEVGQKLSLQFKRRTITGEVIESTLLNPGDRKPYSKRDSNPILHFKVRIPELKLLLDQQMEMTDGNQENLVKSLEELFSSALARGEGQPYN